MEDNYYKIMGVSSTSFGDGIITIEDKSIIDEFYSKHPELKTDLSGIMPPEKAIDYTIGSEDFFTDEAWIQTYSGKRFTPINPNPDSIVIQDIAHSLSMQCRFSGHVKEFYSVAQHSVLVSYLCDSQDAMWGLLHDATEAYLVDIPSPLKRSGKFEAYRECEKNMQTAICTRFGLVDAEPTSVKAADKTLLATEARDLLVFVRKDWDYPVKPAPFKIESLQPKDAEKLFLDRFYELLQK